MSLKGFSITQGAIGPNVNGDGREYGLVANGVAVATKLKLNEPYKLLRLSDAEELGITSAYDTTNKVRLHRHISEFYRLAGEGKVLHLMVVATGVKPADMIPFAKTLAIAAEGAISDIAFAYNPPGGYSETQTDGFNTDCRAAIQPLQAFAEWADSNSMPLHTVLEGRGMTDNVSSAINLRDLRVGDAVLSATKVTLVCGQDYTYADGLDALGKKFADVGTFLGCVASQAWNRNPAELATQSLTDAVQGLWTVGGLSNHKTYNELYEQLETLNDKGYVFPIRYEGWGGYYWNDGHVCSPIVMDAEGRINEHTIYYSHTINQSKRALRQVYLPEVKQVMQLESGKLPAGMLGYYNAIGDNAFAKMAGVGLISSGRTQVDAQSDLLMEKVLRVGFSVVPTGCVGEIVGVINLKNKA